MEWQPFADKIDGLITAYVEQGSQAGLTGSEALATAGQLWTKARDDDGIVPLPAAEAVARLYWFRAQAFGMDTAEGLDDLGTAVGIYAMIDETDPQAVPAELRPLVDQGRRNPLDAALDLLEAVQSGASADGLDEVVDRLSGLQADDTGVQAAIDANLSLALRMRSERTGDRADIDEAIRLGRAAVSVTDDDDRDKAAMLNNLATALGTRFAGHGRPVDLDEAITVGWQAYQATSAADPAWPGRTSNLSGLHRVRFDQFGAETDLDAAIDLAEQAAMHPDSNSPDGALRWSNLSNALDSRFGLKRRPADLDAAVEAGRRAYDLAPASHPVRPAVTVNLANLLATRFEQWGSGEDLEAGIRLLAEALAITPDGSLHRPPILTNLANAHRLRYDRHGDHADLTAAVHYGRQAITSTDRTDPALAVRHSNLAMALLTAYETQHDPQDLVAALRAGRAAVDAVGQRPTSRSKLLSNLAVILAGNAAAAHDPQRRQDLLAEAVNTAEQAVAALTEGHPDRAIRLVNYAGTLLDAGGPRAGRKAVASYLQAAGTVTAPASVRATAARAAGNTAARGGRWDIARHGFRTAIELFGPLVTRAISRPSQEAMVQRFPGLGCDAAAAALHDGDPRGALELLEQGRTVLWSQALQGHAARRLIGVRPGLAQRLIELADALQ
jgi:tetratricopeptide (TPR) repeat protein